MASPKHHDTHASTVGSLSLPNDLADILATTERAERRVERVLALTHRALAADRVALWQVRPAVGGQLTVHPRVSQEDQDVSSAQLADVVRRLAETSLPEGPFAARGQLTVPVIGIGDLLGVLRVERSAAGYEEADLGLLSIIAAQIGTYLKVVHSERALRTSQERLRKVYEAGLIGIAFLDASGAVTEANRPARRMLAGVDANEALQRTQARLGSIIGLAADAIITIDGDQRIVLFNAGAEKIFEYSRDEVLSKPLGMLVSAQHCDEIRRFSRARTDGRVMTEFHPVIIGRRKDGHEFPAEAAISRQGSNGSVLCTLILRDITERTRVENEQRFLAEAGPILARSLDREETLSEIAALAVRHFADCCIVYLFEGEGQIRQVRFVCNDPAKQALVDSLPTAPLAPERLRFARTAIERRQAVLVEQISSEYLESPGQDDTRAGIVRALEPRGFMAVPLLVRERCLGAIVFISTRTARRYGPADLRFAEELARRAALAIDNTALYRSATEAIRDRDDVLAVVAHDLRNPLQTILLTARLLDEELSSISPTSHTRIETILRASARANRLLGDLVEHYQLQAGQLGLARARCSAATIVSEAVHSQQPMAAAASLELKTDVEGEPPCVFADRDRVLQVLENIIGNAIKFTPEGGQIAVGVEPRGEELLFWVRDTGRGIDPGDLPHVFDRFWREDEQDRRGAGLGLSISKGIVRAHGGHIWAESQRGIGTTFFFTLPAA